MKKFGLQLFSIRNEFTDAERTREAFRKIASFGYTQAQTAGTYDYIDPKLFRSFADEAGIEIVGTHYKWDRIRDDIEGTVRYHEILGTNEIGIGGYRVESLEQLKGFIGEFNRLSREYAKHGMVMSYHNHSWEFSNRFRDRDGKRVFDCLLEGLDPETTCFNLDCGWAHLAGMDVYDLLERMAGRIRIMHIKDVQADYKHVVDGVSFRGPERIEIGRGNMNFRGIIRKAEECGVRYIVVEDEF